MGFPFVFMGSHKTLLHYAAQYNSKEIGKILILKGADINAIDIIYQIIHELFLIMKNIINYSSDFLE